MNISECFNFLNFWINKSTGAWYTIQELTDLIDNGQMSLYNDYQPKAATSQRIKDALSPFKETYTFTPSDTLLGIVTVPTERNYMNLLALEIRYAISGRSITKYVPIEVTNEDVKAERLNSQIDTVAATSPVAEQIDKASWQLYPKIQYFGEVTFYRRPVRPVFGYSLISERVVVYNSGTSTQLEWHETQHQEVLLKALSSIGINLRDQEIAEWAQIKTSQNFVGQNKL